MPKPNDPLTLSQLKVLHKYLKRYADEHCKDNSFLANVIYLILKWVQYTHDDMQG